MNFAKWPHVASVVRHQVLSEVEASLILCCIARYVVFGSTLALNLTKEPPCLHRKCFHRQLFAFEFFNVLFSAVFAF
jgi:hypothetical protein